MSKLSVSACNATPSLTMRLPMESDILQDHPEIQRPSSKAPEIVPDSLEAVGKSLQGAVQGGLGTLNLHLLSLRVGLLSWYFCLKHIQWDVLHWIHVSLEVATDLFFRWARNTLLACLTSLLLAWKVYDGAKQHGWRRLFRCMFLGTQFSRGISWLGSCGSYLEGLLTHVAWGPVCSFIWAICHVAQILEVVFEQVASVAEEDEGDGKEETATALSQSQPALLPGQEQGT